MTGSKAKSSPATATLKLVLDTNIVLDWLVFADPAMHPLAEAVRREQVHLYTHAVALGELQRVLDYPALKLDAYRQTAVLTQYKKHTLEIVPPLKFGPQNLLLPVGFPRCKDPDDQPFLALALHAKANALVTRDKAVLALRRRARKFGVIIIDMQQLSAILSSANQPL